MQISLSSGEYKIIDSRQVYLFDQDADFRMDIQTDNGFEFSLLFKFELDNRKKQEMQCITEGNAIHIICRNFADEGCGTAEPLRIARVEDKQWYIIFWSYREGDRKIRSVRYTIFESGCERKENGNQ